MYQRIIGVSRTFKRSLILGLDLVAVLLAVTLAVTLRVSEFWPAEILERSLPFFAVMLGLGFAVALATGIPGTKLSVFDLRAAVQTARFALILTVLGTVLNLVLPLGAPRTVPLIFGPMLLLLSVGWKLAAHWLLGVLQARAHPRMPVAVYGAGAAGIQLISALARSREYRIVAVVDDNPSLAGVMISGHRVQPPAALGPLARAGRIERILLAMPSVSRPRRQEIARRLAELPAEVLTLPAYADIIRTGGIETSLKPVATDDLLGRDAVSLDIPEIARAYQGRVVMVTGAGGSIGSELCRQLLACGPDRIVLYEHSEFALYTIERELGPLAAETGVALTAVLGSVTDRARVRRMLAAHGVEIVLHAAAYKHVPLVEENPLEGARNNVIGTRVVAEAAAEAGIERFILISTDKAVRPTNIMGSTKRLAEMVVQDLAARHAQMPGQIAGQIVDQAAGQAAGQIPGPATRFAMVRFGNVLGSSGSVIPLFRAQIDRGGPVTVTHPEVTRFFMTLPEAARLVLLAGSYATGGDMFVLDMGNPVRIMDLARRMIELSGLSVRDETNPEGDIPIEITGLRPGEKLYEELLIGEDGLLETPHPKILRASEGCPSQIEVAAMLGELGEAIGAGEPEPVRRLIAARVEGYRASGLPQDDITTPDITTPDTTIPDTAAPAPHVAAE